ncbi:MAG TPA: rhomboid family intramembrane serine protease [Gemmatimonadaceae bacterium]|nr:rhomboid family intramembrane serine protease [Gemmatimonadaceae bacterium]
MTHPHPHPETDDRDVPHLTRAVRWMIALNCAVFFLQLTVVGSSNMQEWLGFSVEKFPGGWWTIVASMFVHDGYGQGLWLLALNVCTLYLFGPRLEHSWSAVEFTRYYLLCGLGGWLLHVLLARDALFTGATSAVFGVALAYGIRWPDEPVRLGGVLAVRAAWTVPLLVGVNLVSGVLAGDRTGGAAYLSHLGGLGAGWLLLRWSAASLDRLRQRVSPLPDLPDETPRAVPRALPRSRGERHRDIDEIVAQSNAALRRRTAAAPPAPPAPTRTAAAPADLDSVLDKISERGIDSLTIEERRLLEERSRELRRKQ